MAQIIWTEPSLNDLDSIADYIALDKPNAASRFVKKVFASISRLTEHPLSGKQVEELPDSPYREIVVAPCRVFYRPEKETVYILHVMRGERLLRNFLLEDRNKHRKHLQSMNPSGRHKRRR